MHSNAEIEAIGMPAAMDDECRQGRTPTDIAAENLGYDVRSQAPDGSLRDIEVKARAVTGPIVLTPWPNSCCKADASALSAFFTASLQ